MYIIITIIIISLNIQLYANVLCDHVHVVDASRLWFLCVYSSVLSHVLLFLFYCSLLVVLSSLILSDFYFLSFYWGDCNNNRSFVKQFTLN